MENRTMHVESVVMKSMVRGIIIDNLDAVLLMKMSFPWFGVPVWIAPGGGLEERETPVDGLRRELQEETGRDLPIGPQIWERHFVVEYQSRTVQAHERYFVVRTERFTPDIDGLEEQELTWFRGFRWWSIDELLGSSEPTSPESLPSLIAQVTTKLGR
jgi:ADP-ribose pyrophosphatase YjhB (NUDIX family)